MTKTYELALSPAKIQINLRERGGSVVECRTPEREVRGSRPTAAVLCPWARHFTPRKYWLITQEAMAPSRYDWKIVDWDVKPQHNQPTNKINLQWADVQSDQSLHCALNEKLRILSIFKRTVKTLIGLGGCPGWSKSLLSAQTISLVLSRCGSFDLLCWPIFYHLSFETRKPVFGFFGQVKLKLVCSAKNSS